MVIPIKSGYKTRLFYEATGERVEDYIVKAMKEVPRPSQAVLADRMSQLLRKKFSSEMISVGLLAFWLKQTKIPKKGAK